MNGIDWSNSDLDLDQITGFPDIDGEFCIENTGIIVKGKINSIFEDIEDIKTDIDIIDNDGLIKFILNGELLGIIEYSKQKNNEIYIDMIANINSNNENFEKYNLNEAYNLYKLDYKVKKLIFYMFENFIKIIKSKGYNFAFLSIENKSMYHIIDELIERKIITNKDSRKNNNHLEEITIDF